MNRWHAFLCNRIKGTSLNCPHLPHSYDVILSDTRLASQHNTVLDFAQPHRLAVKRRISPRHFLLSPELDRPRTTAFMTSWKLETVIGGDLRCWVRLNRVRGFQQKCSDLYEFQDASAAPILRPRSRRATVGCGSSFGVTTEAVALLYGLVTFYIAVLSLSQMLRDAIVSKTWKARRIHLTLVRYIKPLSLKHGKTRDWHISNLCALTLGCDVTIGQLKCSDSFQLFYFAANMNCCCRRSRILHYIHFQLRVIEFHVDCRLGLFKNSSFLQILLAVRWHC